MAILANSYVNAPTNAQIVPLNEVEHLKVSLIIRRSGEVTLEEYTTGVINGTNPKLSNDEFVSMFAPSTTDIDAVTAFANSNNLTVHKVYLNSATVKLTGLVKDFNQAFGITLNNVTVDDRTYVSYIGDITIPDDLNGVIECVIGLDNTLILERSFVEPATVGAIGPHLTPEEVATAYEFPSSSGYGVCVGIIELGGGYTQQNLTSSFSRIGLANPLTVDISVGGGSNNPSNDLATQEVMLDMYIVGGIVPDAKLAMYFATNTLSGFVNAVNAAIHDNTNAPSVVSISWGANEAVWGASRLAMDRVLQAAVVLGVTVTVATGDAGSKATQTSPVFTVQYPAASPYALACGGTTLVLNDDGSINSEIAWNNDWGASAGGVSNFNLKPAWQSISTAQRLPDDDIIVNNRSIPDVSGVGDPLTGYQYYFGLSNTFQPNGGGTSAVSPMYAGLVARINQITGKRIGFINALLYANPAASNDITQGNNAWYPTTQGYNTTPGWDAVTGVGSPNGNAILALFYSGIAYPNNNYGFRPTSGVLYPRQIVALS